VAFSNLVSGRWVEPVLLYSEQEGSQTKPIRITGGEELLLRADSGRQRWRRQSPHIGSVIIPGMNYSCRQFSERRWFIFLHPDALQIKQGREGHCSYSPLGGLELFHGFYSFQACHQPDRPVGPGKGNDG
jgi:hypothetical protein